MASQSMTQMAELEAKLSAQAAAGAGKFFGDALQPAIKPTSDAINNWANSGGWSTTVTPA
jgi:hypothetical protein